MPFVDVDLSKLRISKTTVNGVLSFVAVTCLAIPALDTGHVLSAKVLGVVALVAGLCRMWVGKLQRDPDLVKVQTPDGGTATAPGHPAPDDPNQKPVIPQ